MGANQYRQGYNRLLAKYKTQADKGNVRLTQSTLVLMQEINSGKTLYNFPVLENEAVVNPNEEVRLNINDEFLVLEQGVYIVAKLTDDVDPPRETSIWYSYAPVEFQAAWITLQNLYRGGSIRLAVNNVVYVEKWDTKKHEYRGITQMQNSSAGQPFATLPSDDFARSGMFDVEPNVTFSGAKKTEISLSLKQPMLAPSITTIWASANGTLNIQPFWIALVYRGFLAQNASKFQ
jgi:hypothetical protein